MRLDLRFPKSPKCLSQESPAPPEEKPLHLCVEDLFPEIELRSLTWVAFGGGQFPRSTLTQSALSPKP